MTGKPKSQSKGHEPDKTLERELEEGLEETFPALRSGRGDRAGAGPRQARQKEVA